MAKYVRKRTFARRPKGRRFKSKKRSSYKRKAVTMQMLRRVVPKPELKYHNIMNGANYTPGNTFVSLADWNDVFLIAQGTQLGNRIGDKVMLKKITYEFETTFNPAVANTSISTGPTGVATSTAVTHVTADQRVRIVLCDQNWTVGAGGPTDNLELMGSAQPGSPFGQSEYNNEIDYNSSKGKGHFIYKDLKYTHYKAGAVAGGLSVGMPPQAPFITVHRFELSFPGKGKLIQFDSNATQHPVRQPTIWCVGLCDPGTVQGNPGVRLRVARAWFTDA